MGNFCRGAILGMLAGATITAVSIANNKKFYSILKDKNEIAKKKLSNFAGKIKQKLDEKPGCCEECCGKQTEKSNSDRDENNLESQTA